MTREEIDDWLRYFSNNNQCFMSKDGKIITLFKVFQELKELQYLLKIKNDYINELEAYKYNLNRDYLRLEKEHQRINGELREENKRLYKTIEELSQYDSEEDMMNKEDYGKYYIQGSDHYLIPKDVFDELFDKMESWKHDTQKYKEVIDKAVEYINSNDIEVLKYHDIPSETTSYEIVTVDLLKILKGGEM